jgi:hypothetical protein
MRLLRHDGDPAGEFAPRVPLQRTTVERDLPRRGPPHAREQRQERGLAGAVRPQHADQRAGAHVERDARQHRPLRVVGEVEISGA